MIFTKNEVSYAKENICRAAWPYDGSVPVLGRLSTTSEWLPRRPLQEFHRRDRGLEMAQRRRNGDAEEGKAPKKNRPSSKAAVPSAPLRPDEEQDFVIYTDGSCLRNPDGPGGWAVVARNVATGEVTELSDGNPSTTNNRMELLAAIMALRFAPEGTKVALYTDSQYLKNGITKWVAVWKRRGWKKADGQPVLNQGYWVELDKLYNSHDVTFHWVKGHVGVELNERCDQLAKAQAVKYK